MLIIDDRLLILYDLLLLLHLFVHLLVFVIFHIRDIAQVF